MTQHSFSRSFGASSEAPLSGVAANYKPNHPQASPQVTAPKSNVIHTFVHTSLWTPGLTVSRSEQACTASETVSHLASPGCVTTSRSASRSMASLPATGRDVGSDNDEGQTA